MKRNSSGLYLYVLVLSGLFLLPAGKGSLCQSVTMRREAARLIKTDKPCDRLIIVRLGYDAVTAVSTKKGIVVIDAGLSNSLTAEYRKLIEKEFKRKDFAYLINTHAHPDHTGGNQVFSDAVIAGHVNCISEMAEYKKDQGKIKTSLQKTADGYDKRLKTLQAGSEEWKETFSQKIRYQLAADDLLNDRVVTAPSLTFKDSLTLNMGDVSLDLIYFGEAHSKSDIIIHIPELNLLMTGDLFTRYGRPAIENVNSHNAAKWKKAMERIMLRSNKINKIIGGHGQIMEPADLEGFNENILKKYKEIM